MGHECIGCGYCCSKVICPDGVSYHKITDTSMYSVCPSLIWDESKQRHMCKLIQMPDGALKERYKVSLAIGAGCCSGMNDWRRQPLRNRTEFNHTDYSNCIPPLMQKFIRSLSRQFISSDTIQLTMHSLKHQLKNDGVPPGDIAKIENDIYRVFTENRSEFIRNFSG